MLARTMVMVLFAVPLATPTSCGGDEESEVRRRGIGAQCKPSAGCGTGDQLECIPFDGVYCTTSGCQAMYCPSGALCARDSIFGQTFCMLTCNVTDDCNSDRTSYNAAECTTSIEILDEVEGARVCVPASTLPGS